MDYFPKKKIVTIKTPYKNWDCVPELKAVQEALNQLTFVETELGAGQRYSSTEAIIYDIENAALKLIKATESMRKRGLLNVRFVTKEEDKS